jgi:SanA protein
MGSILKIPLGFWFSMTMMLVVVVVSPSVLMRLAMNSYLYSDIEELPAVNAVLVPGASVVRGKPSAILAERTGAAVTLYQEGKADVILVTGAVDGLYDEVTPMKQYLLDAGIPDGDIALDSAGIDTFSSMYRAKNVFLADSLVIATQDFHLPRAVFLARTLDIRAYGLEVSRGGTLFDYLREIPASWKAIFDVLTHGAPGPQMPLAPLFIPGIAAQ